MCCEVIYKNSQDLQQISIDLQIYSMSSDLQNKLTKLQQMSSGGGGRRSKRQQRAQCQRPAGTAAASRSVVSWWQEWRRWPDVLSSVSTVCGLADLPEVHNGSDKTLSVHSVFGCDGEPHGWRNLPVCTPGRLTWRCDDSSFNKRTAYEGVRLLPRIFRCPYSALEERSAFSSD